MRKIKWTYEALAEEALKYSSRWDFQKGNGSAYNAAVKLKLMDGITTHMIAKYVYWSDEQIQNEALKYKTRKKFYFGCRKAYDCANKRNILDSVCAHMKPVRTSWTDAMLSNIASNYKTRNEFQQNDKSAYMAAWSKGILENICTHMDLVLVQWDYDLAAKEALKYTSRKDFSEYSSGAYGFAYRSGILNDICKHIPRTDGGFNPEKPAYLYVVSISGNCENYIGFGITNYITRRLKKHYNKVKSHGFCMESIKTLKIKSGHVVADLERHLKRELPIANTGIDGFRTEAVKASDKDLLLTEIDLFLNKFNIVTEI